MMIKAMKVRKMLSKGCIDFLAHIVSKVESNLSIDRMPIIQEFSDVFLKELLGLAYEQEIKFITKLAPDRMLISKALYKITPTEL